jgi:hypothetical protein
LVVLMEIPARRREILALAKGIVKINKQKRVGIADTLLC